MRSTVHDVALSYQLDQALVLRQLGPGWDKFAIENGAPELVSPNPVGRPLWIFVRDATTVHLYELLFEQVARTRRPLTVPTRCDGASRRRYMDLTIAVAGAGGFLLSSTLVRSEPRQPILLFDRAARRRTASLAVCSWCQRLDAKGQWMEAEDAVWELRLFGRDEMPTLQPTVCDTCERFMVTMLSDDAKLPPP